MTDLKREIKEDNAFVLKAKTHTLNVLLKQIHCSFSNLMSAPKHSLFFSEIINRMTHAMKNNVDLKDLEGLQDLKSRIKQVRLLEKLGKQGFHYDVKEIFEPITKTVADISQKIIEKTKSTTKPIEELHESNVYANPFQLSIENGVFDSSLIRPIAKLLVPTNEIQF